MSLPHHIKQELLGLLFQHTNNAGADTHFVPIPRVPLLTYKGPLASDRQVPHDIQLRVHRNQGSREKEPLDVWARRFMSSHPEYYPLFEKYALDAINRGRRNFGAKAIVERMRWDERFDGGKPFKCPNALTRFLAERFIDDYPDHAGFFRSRAGRE